MNFHKENDAITRDIGDEGRIPFLQGTRSKLHLHLAWCIQVTVIRYAKRMGESISLMKINVGVIAVKKHVLNICGKLGVQSRAQAITQARTLDFLG